jgi:hypothetical protein
VTRLHAACICSALLLSVSLTAGYGKKDEPKTVSAPETPAADEGGPASSAPSGPVARGEGEFTGIRVEIQELKQSGDTLTLRFTLLSDSDQEFDTNGKFTGEASGSRNVGGIYLLDPSNKKYPVVLDEKKRCLCSESVENIKPRSSMNLWAKFKAPAEDVQAITVVIPHFLPIEGVPVSR